MGDRDEGGGMIFLYVGGCVLLAAFFSGLETGLVSADQFALYAAKEKGAFYARAADFLLLKPERLLSTTLVGTNIAVVTATVLLSNRLRESGPEWVVAAGSVGLAVVMLIVAEVIPKSFFRQHADTVSVRLAPVLVAFYLLFYPFATVLNAVVKALLVVFGQLRPTKNTVSSKSSLRLLVRLGSREAGVSLADQRVIEDIFDFSDTLAREVMVQMHRTLACPATMPLQEIVGRANRAEVRYVPIYQGRLDSTVGYIDIEEIVSAQTLEVQSLLHVPVFYPDTKRLPDLLSDMNTRGLRVVFLSNEYGRISGIITPDEIVAEIAGARPGTRGSEEPDVVAVADGVYSVSGTADVEDFSHETGIVLPKGSYDTVGGCVLSNLGRIPETGEEITIGPARFVVTDCDELHIKRLTVQRQPRARTHAHPGTR
jgi:putative hemolysin